MNSISPRLGSGEHRGGYPWQRLGVGKVWQMPQLGPLSRGNR
jgi:hypothetical protein